MIGLTRLSGSAFVLNADLIERLDSTPDTVLTLIDGKKYVVAETMAEVVDAVKAYRRSLISLDPLTTPDDASVRRPHLAPVTAHPASAEGGD